MRALAWAMGVVAALVAGAVPAMAQTPSFPASLEREPLLVWLQRETDIQPSQVIAVTPQALTSILSTFPAGGGLGPRVVIRAEALSEEIRMRSGAMSWHVSLSADCDHRRVRLGETTGYPSRNLLGERKVLRPAETDWRTPEPGTALDHAWRVACEAGFTGPFQSPAVRLAQAEGAGANPPREVTPPKAMAAIARPEPPPRPRPAAPTAAAPVPAATPRPVPVQTAAKPAGSGFAAQIGSGPSEVEAKRLFAELGAAVRGRPTWIETADVSGRTWRRAMVGGFADGSEAVRFCAGLRASGHACFVRPTKGA